MQESLPSLPKRLLQVFFSPGELFAALRANPVWFGALAVSAVLASVSVFLIPTELWVEMTRAQMMERGQEVPSAIGSAGPLVRTISVFGAGLGLFIWASILAGILTFVFSFLLGGDGRYKQFLSVVAHASIIMGLGAVLLLPLRLAQGDPTATLSLGTFFSFLEEGYFLRVLKLLDLFSLWAYGVMAIGVTRIDPKRSLGFALSFFGAFALVFALIFGSFGG